MKTCSAGPGKTAICLNTHEKELARAVLCGAVRSMITSGRKPRNGVRVLPVDPARALERSQVPIDRRTALMTRAEARARVRSDYFELPGLKLTAAQAARLWSLGHDLALSVLEDLTANGFLTRYEDQYARR